MKSEQPIADPPLWRHRRGGPSVSRLLLAGLLAFFGAVLGALAVLSDGVFMDDDLTHYLFARWAWSDPLYFLDIWGRPGFTVPYALVAWIGDVSAGFTASRLLTVAIALGTAWLTADLARRLGDRRAWLAALMLLCIPHYFELSSTTLTETVCAFYIVLGVWGLRVGRVGLAAVAFGLVPLTRHEGILVPAIFGLWLLGRWDWRAMLLCAAPFLLWNLLCALFSWQTPIGTYLRSNPQAGYYGSGGPLYYVLMAAQLLTPAGLGMLACGLLVLTGHSLFRRPRSAVGWLQLSRRQMSVLLTAGISVGIIVLNTLLYMFNFAASGGYMRFLVPAAPLMAVCLSAGLQAWLGHLRGLPTGEEAVRRSPRAEGRVPLRTMGICFLAVLGLVGIEMVNQGLQHPDLVAGQLRQYSLVLLATLAAVAGACWSAGRGGRRAAGTVVVGTLVSLLASVSLVVRPWALAAEQLVVREALEQLESDGHSSGAGILGHTPWVAYFTNQTLGMRDLQASRAWQNSGPGTLLFVDGNHTKRELGIPQSEPIETGLGRLIRGHDRLILVKPTDSRWFEQPYLRVYRRGEEALAPPTAGPPGR